MAQVLESETALNLTPATIDKIKAIAESLSADTTLGELIEVLNSQGIEINDEELYDLAYNSDNEELFVLQFFFD